MYERTRPPGDRASATALRPTAFQANRLTPRRAGRARAEGYPYSRAHRARARWRARRVFFRDASVRHFLSSARRWRTSAGDGPSVVRTGVAAPVVGSGAGASPVGTVSEPVGADAPSAATRSRAPVTFRYPAPTCQRSYGWPVVPSTFAPQSTKITSDPQGQSHKPSTPVIGVAESTSAARTSAGVSRRPNEATAFDCSTATAPATCGDDIDVPVSGM